MSNNQLMIFQSDADMKYRFFTKDREEKTEEITNEQLAAAERQKVNQDINDFFFDGMGGGIDDLVNMYADMIEQINESTKDQVIKVEDLKVETTDPFHTKTYEEEKTIFARRRAENKIEKDPLSDNIRPAQHSTSTDWVKDNQNVWGSKSSYGSNANNGYGAGYANATQPTQPTPKTGDGVSFDHQLPNAARSMQDVAHKSAPWTEPAKKDGWDRYTKKSLFRRVKDWFKSKPGRTMVKVGLLVGMQLGMAYIGKRYEYEGIGKMAVHIGLLLGTFYVSKELQSDGMDVRGFAI